MSGARPVVSWWAVIGLGVTLGVVLLFLFKDGDSSGADRRSQDTPVVPNAAPSVTQEPSHPVPAADEVSSTELLKQRSDQDGATEHAEASPVGDVNEHAFSTSLADERWFVTEGNTSLWGDRRVNPGGLRLADDAAREFRALLQDVAAHVESAVGEYRSICFRVGKEKLNRGEYEIYRTDEPLQRRHEDEYFTYRFFDKGRVMVARVDPADHPEVQDKLAAAYQAQSEAAAILADFVRAHGEKGD